MTAKVGGTFKFMVEGAEKRWSVVQLAPDGKKRIVTTRSSVFGLTGDADAVYWMERAAAFNPDADESCSLVRFPPNGSMQTLTVRRNPRFRVAVTAQRVCWIEEYKEPDNTFFTKHRLTCVPKNGGAITQAKEDLDKGSDLFGFQGHVYVLPEHDRHTLTRFLVAEDKTQPPRADGDVALPDTSHYGSLTGDGTGVYWIDKTTDTINWIGHEAFEPGTGMRPVTVAHVPDGPPELNSAMFSGASQLHVDAGNLRWSESPVWKELPREAIQAILQKGGVKPSASALPEVHCRRAPEADSICEHAGKVGFECSGGTVGDAKKAHPSCTYIADSKFCCPAAK